VIVQAAKVVVALAAAWLVEKLLWPRRENRL